MADAVSQCHAGGHGRFLRNLRIDFASAFHQSPFWSYQAYQKVRLQYAHSLIGPLWVTLTMAIQLIALTFLFTGLSGADLSVVAPWIAIGVIAWTFFSNSLNEAASVLLSNRGYFMEAETSIAGFVISILIKNTIIAAHHLILFAGLVVWFRLWPDTNWLWLLASIPVFFLTTASLALILAILTPRFRDLRPLTGNLLMVGFFLTPVMWRPQSLIKNEFIATFNPLTHLLAIVREPLLGHPPDQLAWVMAICLCLLSTGLAIFLLGAVRHRVTLWV
ncbi:MAG: ABC transporter permease [Hyphomonas sp.]